MSAASGDASAGRERVPPWRHRGTRLLDDRVPPGGRGDGVKTQLRIEVQPPRGDIQSLCSRWGIVSMHFAERRCHRIVPTVSQRQPSTIHQPSTVNQPSTNHQPSTNLPLTTTFLCGLQLAFLTMLVPIEKKGEENSLHASIIFNRLTKEHKRILQKFDIRH